MVCCAWRIQLKMLLDSFNLFLCELLGVANDDGTFSELVKQMTEVHRGLVSRSFTAMDTIILSHTRTDHKVRRAAIVKLHDVVVSMIWRLRQQLPLRIAWTCRSGLLDV